MRGETVTEKFVYWLVVDRIPVTKLLILVNIATFLAVVLFGAARSALVPYLAYESRLVVLMPWTLITYPLIALTFSPINLLFQGYWLWVTGGSLERSWGSRTFAIFFFAMSAISAIGLFIGGMLGHTNSSAAGLWLPLAGLTVAFAMLNPEQQILFFFIIPMKLKYLALLDVAIVLVSYGRVSLALGIFALAGCAFSYWYVRTGRSFDFPVRRQDRGEVIRLYNKPSLLAKLNPLKWIREYKERKRLRDFFDKSGFKD
ncbi:MAG: rhomboid family intramembrane serine protease [Armatimonadetes bacterium]|nr:rhomboid family intramembrane serine protease [Armatimonadota bacterium]